jgi:hypothetical protein
MIPFHRAAISDKAQYDSYLFAAPERGCEYAFANLFLWGRQEIAFMHGCVMFFSHLFGKSVYPYPIGDGDKRAALEAILADSRERGIPCRISGMSEADKNDLEAWFPGRFRIRPARDSFDYVYAIDALADLKGKKLQKKRNHFNRFRATRPDYRTEPITCENIARVQHMVNDWYVNRRKSDPEGDYFLESLAMAKAFRNFDALSMEGLVLMDGGEVLAVTMGSRMNDTTFDIHFEKAREDADGAYPAINCEFARYLRLKYPEVKFLNREDDMGLEGLRKAKLSYCPDHMVEKYKALLAEDIYED